MKKILMFVLMLFTMIQPIKANEQEQLIDSITIDDSAFEESGKITVNYEYSVKSNTKVNTPYIYKLPTQLKITKNMEQPLIVDGVEVGVVNFNTDNTMTITFTNGEYINSHHNIKGKIFAEYSVDHSQLNYGEDNALTFTDGKGNVIAQPTLHPSGEGKPDSDEILAKWGEENGNRIEWTIRVNYRQDNLTNGQVIEELQEGKFDYDSLLFTDVNGNQINIDYTVINDQKFIVNLGKTSDTVIIYIDSITDEKTNINKATLTDNGDYIMDKSAIVENSNAGANISGDMNENDAPEVNTPAEEKPSVEVSKITIKPTREITAENKKIETKPKKRFSLVKTTPKRVEKRNLVHKNNQTLKKEVVNTGDNAFDLMFMLGMSLATLMILKAVSSKD